MKNILALSLVICLLTACHNQSAETKTAVSKADTAAYYPVANFFHEQLQYVDLRAFPIKLVHTVNGKKDSAVISKEQFLAWGNLFTQQGAQFNKTKASFKETVFSDQSTQSNTLTYSPLVQNANGIQSVDVLLDESTSQPKRIFIKATHITGDTATTEQFSWKSFKSFQFTRFITAHNFSSVELAEVSWAPAEQK